MASLVCSASEKQRPPSQRGFLRLRYRHVANFVENNMGTHRIKDNRGHQNHQKQTLGRPTQIHGDRIAGPLRVSCLEGHKCARHRVNALGQIPQRGKIRPVSAGPERVERLHHLSTSSVR